MTLVEAGENGSSWKMVGEPSSVPETVRKTEKLDRRLGSPLRAHFLVEAEYSSVAALCGEKHHFCGIDNIPTGDEDHRIRFQPLEKRVQFDR